MASVPPGTGHPIALRILAVGNMYPPQHTGGYEVVWQAAMRAASALGHQVRILTSDYRDDAHRPEEDPDVHRTLRWYWDLRRYEFPRLSLWERFRLERHNHAELRRQIADFVPDVVAWWSMGCMSLSLIEHVRRTRIPAVFVVHDDWLEYGWHHDQWLHTWNGRRRRRVAPLIERAGGIPTSVDVNDAGPFVFNSAYTSERAQQARLDTPALSVVYPGIDERFQVPAGPRDWRWHLLYVGRIDRQKGIDTAITALAELPAATLTVRGSGDERYVEEMNQMANGLGVADRVHFGGFASSDELPALYADADAVIFPVRWNEPFGLVPLEAMGVGRPVVSTARGGTREYLRHGENALVFTSEDAHGLARLIQRLAADPALRDRLRDGGFRTAARYTAARFAEQTVDAIVAAARQTGSGALNSGGG